MIDCSLISLKKRNTFLRSNTLVALLIGCNLNQLPSLGSYYDFMNRLWLRDFSLGRNALKHLYRYNFNRKSQKGQKLSRIYLKPERAQSVLILEFLMTIT